MIVNFVHNDKLSSIILPNKISGQFWFSDPNGCNVVRIEGVNNKWVIKTQSQYTVRVKNITTGNSTDITSDEIVSKRLYQIKNLNSIKDRIYLFTEEYTDNRIEFYLFQIPEFFTLTIGNGKVPKTITYDNEYVSANHATIQYSNGQWTLQDDDSKNGTFVNGVRVNTETLKYGDMIFIMGMKIVVGKGCFSINNPDKKVKFCTNELSVFTVPEMIEIESDEIQDEEIYFDRSPRFNQDIEEVEMPIDSPPRENTQDEMPIILTVGSAMTMASMTTGAFAITNAIASGNVKSAIPTVVMSGSMCLGTLLWPTLTRRYTRKQKDINENLRRAKYNEYLEMKRLDIKVACDEQAQILRENNITIEECEHRIMQVQRNLWERSIGQDDF